MNEKPIAMLKTGFNPNRAKTPNFITNFYRGRKMNASLEKAIQEAMMELDRMSADE